MALNSYILSCDTSNLYFIASVPVTYRTLPFILNLFTNPFHLDPNFTCQHRRRSCSEDSDRELVLESSAKIICSPALPGTTC